METAHWVRALAAVVGALSIYIGYRLFCDSIYLQRRSTLFTNLAGGALLALFGFGVLYADIRSIRTSTQEPRPAWQRKSAEQGSTGSPNLRKRASIPDRLV